MGGFDIAVNWKPVMVAVLAIVAVLTASPAVLRMAIVKGKGMLAKLSAGSTAGGTVEPADSPPLPGGEWPADAGPPADAVRYAEAINRACGKMPPEFFREQILAGATTHKAALARAECYEKQNETPEKQPG
jgi:hypothetical protein